MAESDVSRTPFAGAGLDSGSFGPVQKSSALYTDTAFENYVNSKRRKVTNINGDTEWYISYAALREYWTSSAITTVLNGPLQPFSANEYTILASHLRVWSILVFIGRPEFINEFIRHSWSDTNLPMKLDGGPRPDAVHGTGFEEMRAEFCKKQWNFQPVEFFRSKTLDQRELDHRFVLPVDYGNRLTPTVITNPNTIVRRVQIRDDCSDFPNVRSPLSYLFLSMA